MKIGIIGLGLMGGSIAKALRGNEIIAFNRNDDVLEKAINEGVITKYTLEVNEEFKDVDMLFICTPVKYVYQYIKEVSQYLKKDCIVTDIGSTKNDIVTKVERDFPNINFIGAHPMAGSEKMRYDNSSEDLFENSYYIITKTDNTKDASLKKLCEVIEILKAMPIVINSKEHDYIVSIISHVPHVIAATLVNILPEEENENEARKLASGGFKDVTRIASSNPEVWQNICIQNKEGILKGLQNFKSKLNSFEESLINNDEEKIFEYFSSAKKYRDEILEVKNDI